MGSLGAMNRRSSARLAAKPSPPERGGALKRDLKSGKRSSPRIASSKGFQVPKDEPVTTDSLRRTRRSSRISVSTPGDHEDENSTGSSETNISEHQKAIIDISEMETQVLTFSDHDHDHVDVEPELEGPVRISLRPRRSTVQENKQSRSLKAGPNTKKKKMKEKIKVNSEVDVDGASPTVGKPVIHCEDEEDLKKKIVNTSEPVVEKQSKVDATGDETEVNINRDDSDLIILEALALKKTEASPGTLASSSEVPQPDSRTEGEGGIGKLRSSVADAQGMSLARSYRRTLQEMEEYSLNYITQEFQHPVITCFRELTRSDISTIVSSGKLRKTCNSLELSVIYLGLIDLLATANNNPLYGDNCNAKFSKNVSSMVQRILVEFKTIIGTWALSDKEVFSNRSTLILRYLRSLAPMFDKAQFDEEFIKILDSIESEVIRLKSNQQKLKTFNPSSSSSVEMKSLSDEAVIRSALNEILINVSLKTASTENDDEEEVSVISESSSLPIFGKPLKGSPSTSDLTKKKMSKQTSFVNDKIANKLDSTTTNASKSDKPVSSKPSKSIELVSGQASLKRNADEELCRENEKLKKPRVEAGQGVSPVSRPRPEKSSLRDYFLSSGAPSTSTCSTNASSSSTNSPSAFPKAKPAVNAFALMMSKSRELAQKKKLEKMGVPVVPTLGMSAVKT